VRVDQDRAGLHHLCLRARSRADVDVVHRFAVDELAARIVHPAEEGSQFAPGYYSVLFEDPDGIRIEINHVPGKGHFGAGGRLGPGGAGTAVRIEAGE
jgi:catechol 2,3-dioxygenase-like lactoylglutathione lyase family enzyme